MMMRFKESPEPAAARHVPARQRGQDHARGLHIGDTQVMASDGRAQGQPKFEGFALSLDAKTEAEATKLFNARRRRQGPDAADEDILLPELRHGRGPLRRRLDGHYDATAVSAGARDQ
jgi:hypothetical protein